MLSFKRLKQSKAARNAAASYFAFFSTAASGFLSIPVAVHFFDKEEIGLWTAVNAMVAYLLWMDLGIGGATGRKMADAVVSKDQREIDNWWTTTQISLWILGFLLMVVGLLCTPVFIAIFKVPPHLKADAWLLLAVSSAIAGINLPLRAVPGLLTAQERFHWVPICQGTMPWLQLAGFYFMVSRGHGLSSYLWGTAASQFFVFIFYRSLVLRSEQRPRWTRAGFNRERLRSLFGFSLSMSVVGLKDTMLQSLPTMILARHGGLAFVPIYTITARAPLMATSLARRTIHAFFPALVNLHVAGEKEAFLAKQQLTAMLTLTVATIAAGGVLLFNQFFVELIAGKDYYAGTHATIWFALATVVAPMCAVYSCLLQISGNMGKTPLVSVLSLVASFIAAIIALDRFGLAGLAAVFAFEPLVYGIYGLCQGSKNSGYQIREFPIKSMVCSLLSCLLVGTGGIAMNLLPPGTHELHLWNKSATLPSPYQWVIGISVILTAVGFGIHSLKQKNRPA
jgi:O-antigen/teichoic acid export membrane protein